MNQENKILELLSRIVDLLLLNFLFIITSIPIFTIGASLCALYSVNLKMTRKEESYVIKDFFRSFRQNFRQATPSFIAFAAAFSLLGMNLWISTQTGGTFSAVLRTVAGIFLLAVYICFLYYFPILARFQFTCRQVMMHIPHMILTWPGYFFTLILLNIPIFFFAFYSLYTAAALFIITCIIGASAFTYVESLLFRKIFEKYERKS